MKNFFFSITIASFFFSFCTSNKENLRKPNVLFIAVDDLRPELNCYGKNQIKSPNMDRLAQAGIVFTRAYCNVPVCGASRASLMTGVRPTYNRFLHYYAQADVEASEIKTIPEHFKNNGYKTISIGKVFHTPADHEKRAWSETPFRLDHHRLDDGSWSDQGWQNYLTQENTDIARTKDNGAAWPWEILDDPDNIYFDERYADKAIEYLRTFKNSGAQFFLGLGFLKPHLPFNAPKKYWEMYSRGEIDLPDNPFLPEHAPPQAKFNWGELRAYHGIPEEGPVSDSIARTLIHGYYACVSATDALIGQVLDELRNSGLDKNTIVMLWGDHGWNLGEHGFWCKHVNFETSLRSTLIISAPGYGKGNANGIVEFVDLYPTLVDLCDVPAPKHKLEGISLVPMLQNPAEKVKDFAMSKWMKGVTLINDRYFYTEWHDAERNRVGRMLYDHKTDPGENMNIAENKKNASLVEELSGKLNKNLANDYWDPSVGKYHR